MLENRSLGNFLSAEILAETVTLASGNFGFDRFFTSARGTCSPMYCVSFFTFGPLTMKLRTCSTLLSLLLAVAAFLPSLGAQDANGVYSKVDEPPVPIKTPPPKYPDSLRREGVSGVVSVTVVIDEKGAVTDVTVSKSTHADFERPSIEAMRSWKFKPAKVGGEPVKVRVTVPMRFNVQD